MEATQDIFGTRKNQTKSKSNPIWPIFLGEISFGFYLDSIWVLFGFQWDFIWIFRGSVDSKDIAAVLLSHCPLDCHPSVCQQFSSTIVSFGAADRTP